MTSVFALLAAALYGAADFLGGTVAKRVSAVSAAIATQGAGLALLLLGTPWMLDAHLSAADAGFGALAGLTGGVGVALLYHALAIGPMSVVAPITAVCAVVVPLVAGLLFGERLTPASALGVALAIVAVVLLGQDTAHDAPSPAGAPPGTRFTRGVRVALLSGVAIGGFFVALGRTQEAAGLWPLAVSRAVSISLFLALSLATRRPVAVPRAVLAPAIACGGLDMMANALYLVAVRHGQLSLVATLASLYPASTLLLARVVLGERLGRWQQLGVVTAGAAIVLIVSSS